MSLNLNLSNTRKIMCKHTIHHINNHCDDLKNRHDGSDRHYCLAFQTKLNRQREKVGYVI